MTVVFLIEQYASQHTVVEVSGIAWSSRIWTCSFVLQTPTLGHVEVRSHFPSGMKLVKVCSSGNRHRYIHSSHVPKGTQTHPAHQDNSHSSYSNFEDHMAPGHACFRQPTKCDLDPLPWCLMQKSHTGLYFMEPLSVTAGFAPQKIVESAKASASSCTSASSSIIESCSVK